MTSATGTAAQEAALADAGVSRFLLRTGLARADEAIRCTPLTGGVSSDIWRVDLPGRSLCVKRALAQLKVAAQWNAPLSRNAYEWAWICFAASHERTAVPHPLAHDDEAGLFAMQFLEPASHPVWKNELLAGTADASFARSVGALLARLHAASADDAGLEAAFATTNNFRALRLEPYLATTAQCHPAVAPLLRREADRLAAARIALVHGDVSPKNILVGPAGPVFLDAECAWYGDPAFDLAFCLNHLLLKCVYRPDRCRAFLDCYDSLAHAYLACVSWEAAAGPGGLEARAATLLPMLLLARVDGKSPVEYLGDEAQRALVRKIALPLIASPVPHLSEIALRVQNAVEARQRPQ